MDSTLLIILGLFAQCCFAARMLIQWLKSEKAKKVVSPSMYWVFSLLGSTVLLIYGIFRFDIVVIVGQIINFYIYIRNLYLKNIWSRLPIFLRLVISLLPILILGYTAINNPESYKIVFDSSTVALWVIAIGGLGQLLFTFRFVYQWYYSEKRKMSILPLGFWVISILGSGLLITYFILRQDKVLWISHVIGLFVYLRNLMIWKKSQGRVS